LRRTVDGINFPTLIETAVLSISSKLSAISRQSMVKFAQRYVNSHRIFDNLQV
jgi:hypothetical protein